MKKLFLSLVFISLLPGCAGTPQQHAERLGRIAQQVAVEEIEQIIPRRIDIGASAGAGLKGGRGSINLFDFDLDEIIHVW